MDKSVYSDMQRIWDKYDTFIKTHNIPRKTTSQNVSAKKTIIFRLRIVLFGPIAPRVYHHYDDYKALIALYFKYGFCDDNQKIIFSGSYASDDKNITLYTGA